jgi:peptide/nickel transport system permease protein
MSTALMFEAVDTPPRQTGWRWLLRQLVRKRSAQIGGSVLLVILLCALIAPVLVPYDPLKVDAIIRLQPPSAAHILGTDELGRDVFSRILYGCRYFVLICWFPSPSPAHPACCSACSPVRDRSGATC